MLFNTLDFAIFLPLVFGVYWVFKKSVGVQNGILVLASYIFYGWWDWRFLSLIFFSTIVDYSVARLLGKTSDKSKRKRLLWTSIGVNVGLLGLFKYYNFFLENFVEAFSLLGTEFNVFSMQIILPVGISFYTFQTLSYTIDVYRNKLKPTQNFLAFGAYVSFFPQLVAGPIERATNLLPQFLNNRVFNYNKSVDGLRQILWGLFKKVVIADNAAVIVNLVFSNHETYNASTLIIGAVFFAFQIYGDFSGYSDIAIGVSRLFGFNLKKNFAFPYFSRDIGEFWRRWHISLSSWFRDYVYIPLGGSRGSKSNQIRNVFIIFLVSGFWHGAAWTFVIWGALNACYFLPLLLANTNRKHLDIVAENRVFPSFREFLNMGMTFMLTTFAWIFFRADSLVQALSYIRRLFSTSIFSLPQIEDRRTVFITGVLILVFLIIEWMGRWYEYGIERLLFRQPKSWRRSFYYVLMVLIFWFAGKEQEFIYFQF